MGTRAIESSGVPFGVAHFYVGEEAVAFFGDGGANIGATHESLNLAAVWRVPCVFVCENNGYARRTPTEYSTAGEVWRRAAGYDIPGEVATEVYAPSAGE
jgi:TPP-dependent pyruvate/acetoin dehydrogenase alpha subunit